MNTLTIDIGNNRIKLEYWNQDNLIHHQVYDELPFSCINEKMNEWDIKGIILASVRTNVEETVNKLKNITGCHTVVNFNMNEIKKYGDKIKYEGNIGADRVAAFLGAQSVFKGAKLIVDAGTALTLDVADKEGKFCGGNISLGMVSRLKALANAACLLPLVESKGEVEAFGHDTVSAIKAGVKNGIVGEILFNAELGKKIFDIEGIIMTGGDAEYIYPTVSKHWKNCLWDKFLVGKGLNYHLRTFYLQ